MTERDRSICSALFDHRVLTTNQICQLAFDSLRIAQERLSDAEPLEHAVRENAWVLPGGFRQADEFERPQGIFTSIFVAQAVEPARVRRLAPVPLQT